MATTRPICSFVRQAAPAHTREREEPLLVEEPDRAEEQRRRERHRVKVVDDEPLRGRVEQVYGAEEEARAVAAEVFPCQEVDGNRSESYGNRLDDQQELRARPEPPEGHEDNDDRVEMRSESRDLVTVNVRHFEESAVCGRPYDLGEVADVEATGLERTLLQDGEGGHSHGERADEDAEQRARVTHAAAIARSTTVRQRIPSVASSACAS